MSVLTVFVVILITKVALENVINLFELVKKTKKTEERGQTPLKVQNYMLLLETFVVEIVVSLVVVYLSWIVLNAIGSDGYSIISIVITYIVADLTSESISYLSMWGTTSLIVKSRSNKEKQKIEEQMYNNN